MHECENCGTECDCDGEDLDQPQPPDHACINPQCEDEPEYEPELTTAQELGAGSYLGRGNNLP